MKYSVLFDVRIQHEGEPPIPCAALELRASESQPTGVRALRRHQLLVRQRSDGVEVLGQLDAHRRPHIDFDDETFSFELRSRDPQLALRSEVDGIRKHLMPVFRRSRYGGELKLHRGTTPLAPGVLANVEIGRVDGAWLRHPHHFTLTLEHRLLTWVYYVVSRRKGQTPEIVDTHSERNLSFHNESLTENQSLTEHDPVGAALLARHTDREVFRLSSNSPLPGVASPLRGLSLRLGEQTLLAELPAPPVHQHMSLVTADSKPRDAIYRVLET